MLTLNLLPPPATVSRMRSRVRNRQYYRRLRLRMAGDPELSERLGERNKANVRRVYRRKSPETRAAERAPRAARTKAERSALKRRPCMDCKGRFPTVCMDFDHRDPTTKLEELRYQATPARGVTSLRKAVRDEEIAKCDLVCSNCHRIRTARRLGSLSAEPWWTE